MHPYAFDGISLYGVFLVVAILGAATVALGGLRRNHVRPGHGLLFLLLCAGGGLAGAKLWSRWQEGVLDWSFPSALTHGYRYPGAIIGMGVMMAIFGRRLCRVPLLAVGDAVMPAVGVGAALLRFGCLAYGCCFGTPSTVRWAIAFPKFSPPWLAHVAAGLISAKAAASLPVHPLQVYFMMWSLIATAVARWLEPRKTYAGQVVLVFLAVDQLGKFGLEFLRQERLAGVQGASLVIGLAAAAALAVGSARGSPAGTMRAGRPRSHRARAIGAVRDRVRRLTSRRRSGSASG
jgi:phosphatidylglycerol:prolipoprotein diacylglycerol transferase